MVGKGCRIIEVTCKCGSTRQITYKNYKRKWADKDYLCKSCHVKTYINKQSRISKFRESHKLTTQKPEIKQKLSRASKKLWTDEKRREHSQRQKEKYREQTERDKLSKRSRDFWSKEENKRKHSELSKKIYVERNLNREQRLTVKEFIERSVGIHGNKYNYSKVEYKSLDDKIIIVCPKHGEYQQYPRNHLQGKGCMRCGTTISKPHQLIINSIDEETEINARSIISPYEIDVWIPSYNIGIEIHGSYWHGINKNTTLRERNRLKNLCKTEFELAKQREITLLQFWEHDIYNKYDIILSIINHHLGRSSRIFARKCQINKTDNKELSGFWQQNHMQGHKNSRICYMLTYGVEVVAAIGFSKHPKHGWEITRYCNKLNTTVIGGFSKLLHRFIIDHSPRQIITYCDKMISNGGLYSKFFKYVGDTEPGYVYYRSGEVLSRYQCQKHKLFKLLERFDKSKSETWNMLENGYVKLFDAGNMRFLLK